MQNVKKMIALEISAKAALEAARDAMQRVADMADDGDEWAIAHLGKYSIPAMQKASSNFARIQHDLKAAHNIVIAS